VTAAGVQSGTQREIDIEVNDALATFHSRPVGTAKITTIIVWTVYIQSLLAAAAATASSSASHPLQSISGRVFSNTVGNTPDELPPSAFAASAPVVDLAPPPYRTRISLQERKFSSQGFFMCVPGLSWQTIVFHEKMTTKRRRARRTARDRG
jgi:hypothetical protein